MQATYERVQRSPLFLLLIGLGGLFFLILRTDPAAPAWMPYLPLAILAPLAFCLRTLTVRDRDQELDVRFGPVPLFKTRLAYADMVLAEPARSTVLDGWGVHYGFGAGWIYNLWGRDCVRITRHGCKPVRIGTEDPEGLAAFLNSRAVRRRDATADDVS